MPPCTHSVSLRDTRHREDASRHLFRVSSSAVHLPYTRTLLPHPPPSPSSLSPLQDRAEQKMLDALADELDAEVGAIAKEKQKEPPSRVEVEDALHRALAEERERPSREHMEWAEGEKRRFRAEQARISAQLDAASHVMDEVVQRLIERGKLRGRSELAAQEAVQRLLLNLGDAKVRV